MCDFMNVRVDWDCDGESRRFRISLRLSEKQAEIDEIVSQRFRPIQSQASLRASWIQSTSTQMKLLLAIIALFATSAVVRAQAIASTPAVQLSQQRAVDKYPDIGVAGSALNKAFIDVFNHWKVWKPQVLQLDNWPEIVAAQAISVLNARRDEEERRARLGR